MLNKYDSVFFSHLLHNTTTVLSASEQKMVPSYFVRALKVSMSIIIIYQLFLVYGSLERLEFFWPYLTDKNPRYGIYNKTPLHFLATHGLTDVVEFMIDHLEDPNPADSFSITPLHNASRYVCIM